MFQALVKTAPGMLGSYTFSFSSPEERAEFVGRADVYWYFFPEQDEFFFGGALNGVLPSWDSPRGTQRGWKKGGAWKAQEESQKAAQAPEASADSGDQRW